MVGWRSSAATTVTEMFYKETPTGYLEHRVVLTSEETDRFFEPFDPHDAMMPSHLFYARHRYIKEDIYAWLVENFGTVESMVWKSGTHYLDHEQVKAFDFADKNHAMLFMTFWAGAPVQE